FAYDWEYWISPQDESIYISPSCERITGYSSNEFMQNRELLISIVHPDDVANLKNHKHNILDNKEIEPIEFRIITKSGEERWIGHVCQTVYDSNGVNIGIRGSNRDITEKKLAESALQESEEKYRTLVETIEEGIGNVDENETFTFVNQAAADICGYSKDEMIGKNLKELTSLEMFQKILEETSTRQKGDSGSYELQILRKNGEERIITVLATPIITENGIHKGSFGIFHDITERKQAEETLKESRDQYESLFNQVADPVVVFDQETKKFLDCNTAMIHKYGYSQDELSGMTPLELHPADEDIENVKINIDDKKNVSPNEYLHKGKDGTIYNVEAHSREIFYKDRKAWITIIRDITEHKKAEDALKASEIQLRELNATKDKFFSIIAHDLRSPFNTMLGFSELLNEEFDEHSTEEKKKFIGIIYEGLQNTLKLLDNLLYWARSQKGTIVYNPEKINLYLKAKETYDFLNQSAEKKSIKLINQIAENVYVEADIDMLATIIRNLFSNAIKYTHKYGKITIKTFLVPDENNIQYVGISVSDTGVGIPKEMQSKLFDIGENTSMQGTENETGTGLGLILCKEFVEKHGGKIWVESEIDKGSTFYFTIP
ncbi:MAG: PAS domain S-box protein, partial [Bacteroidales bacterium]|nr:PAS domain S-box protein [Bacteroidales bacterium]